MHDACSGTQADDTRFGITLDFTTKLHNGSITAPEAKRFLRRENPFEQPRKEPYFTPVTITHLGNVRGKQTEKCFTSPNRCRSSKRFDGFFPAHQPASGPCSITRLCASRDWRFRDIISALSPGLAAEKNLQVLGNFLIDHGFTITLAQVELLTRLTDETFDRNCRKSEADSMYIGGPNFFFAETSDAENPVMMGKVGRTMGTWFADEPSKLDDDVPKYTICQLLVRNLDLSILKL